MIDKFTSKISLNIKGRNINRFIKKLTTRKIDILSLKYKNSNEVDIIIYKKDYSKVLKIKSIYNVVETGVYGLLKIKRNILLNKHLIIILLIGFTFFLTLTHIVFDVEVIHSSKEIRNLITEELNKEGIKKYTFKKNYNELQKIKEKIIAKYPDKIEWLEIEEHGTKYTIRVEERTIKNNEEDTTPRNIIAKKNGIIKKVIAENGEIVKQTDEYVKQGDIVISGDLVFNNEVKGQVRATGHVYAETWYVTKTEYPFAYYEEKATGKTKEAYVIKFLNHDIELSLNKYKTKEVSKKVILSHPYLPIKLVKQTQRETEVINQVLTFEQALDQAQKLSIEKIENNLKDEEYIIRSKYLKSTVKDSTIEVEMFFAVYEDITDYGEIG